MIIALITGVVRDDIAVPQEDGTSFEATKKMLGLANEILLQYDKDAHDLTVACLGDSITAGSGAYSSYPAYMAQILGARYVNLGIKGSSIAWGGSDPMVTRYGEIPSGSDVIILYGGVNDSVGLSDANYGNETDPYTFCGSLYTLLTGIQNKYPNAYFFVVIPPPIAGFDRFQSQNSDLYDQDVLRKEIVRQCKELGIDTLNLFDMNVMNPLDPTVRQMYFGDNIHPNEEGLKVLAMLTAAKIAKNIAVIEAD